VDGEGEPIPLSHRGGRRAVPRRRRSLDAVFSRPRTRRPDPSRCGSFVSGGPRKAFPAGMPRGMGLCAKSGSTSGARSLAWIGHRVPNPAVEGSNPSAPEPSWDSSGMRRADDVLRVPKETGPGPLRRKGVCYDVGRVMLGRNRRPDFDPRIAHRGLEIIRKDRHCHAVRLQGLDLSRFTAASEDALGQGLEVGVSPEMSDARLTRRSRAQSGAQPEPMGWARRRAGTLRQSS
jgi:hypothetical protein